MSYKTATVEQVLKREVDVIHCDGVSCTNQAFVTDEPDWFLLYNPRVMGGSFDFCSLGCLTSWVMTQAVENGLIGLYQPAAPEEPVA
jgi:hypothetical protein